MRLIDADALMNKLGIEKECSVCEQNSEPYCKWNPDIVDVCEAICTAPTVTADSDTISRQDAINLIERYCDNGCEISEYKWCPDCQQSKFAEMIKALPQSPSRPKVIHCKDCKWRNDVGHWVGCPILNSDDDNYCSYAELP